MTFGEYLGVLIVLGVVLVLSGVTVTVVCMFQKSGTNSTTSNADGAGYRRDYGEPVDYINFKRKDYNSSDVKVFPHPNEKN
jgi:hypothetical protein